MYKRQRDPLTVAYVKACAAEKKEKAKKRRTTKKRQQQQQQQQNGTAGTAQDSTELWRKVQGMLAARKALLQAEVKRVDEQLAQAAASIEAAQSGADGTGAGH